MEPQLQGNIKLLPLRSDSGQWGILYGILQVETGKESLKEGAPRIVVHGFKVKGDQNIRVYGSDVKWFLRGVFVDERNLGELIKALIP